MVGLRWAFQFGCWKPTAQEWMSMIAAVQLEERERINRFVFQRDAKAALVGRLLIRKAICHLTGLPYNDVHVGRTEKGKPYLTNALPNGFQLDFNISHDGDFAVLAAETSHLVGIDTVQLDRTPGSKTPDEFFDLMSRQLTRPEWDRVRSTTDERVQLATFYRHWCLKESYVKMLGVGVGLSLDRLTCQISSPLSSALAVDDTKMSIDGQLDTDTYLEELLLDDNYAVSVALKRTVRADSPVKRTPTPFTILNVSDLLDGIQTIVSSGTSVSDDWTSFCRKAERPLLKQR